MGVIISKADNINTQIVNMDRHKKQNQLKSTAKAGRVFLIAIALLALLFVFSGSLALAADNITGNMNESSIADDAVAQAAETAAPAAETAPAAGASEAGENM